MNVLRIIGNVMLLPFRIEVDRRRLESIKWVRQELIKAYEAQDGEKAAQLTYLLDELTSGRGL